ncbi:MAG: GspE/PulE family protein [Patescibacteria group bacterium]
MPENIKTTDNFELYLVEQGLIPQELYEKLKEQATTQNQAVLDLVTSQKILTPEALAKAKAAFLNIPYINFLDKKVDQTIIGLIPEDTYLFYKFFAFEKNGQTLSVAITDPTNIQALEALEFFSKKAGYNIQLYVTDDQSFNKVLNKEKQAGKIVGEALTEFAATEKVQQAMRQSQQQQKVGALQDLVQDAPISKIVDVIMTNAIDGNASDIHIEPSEKDVRVRYRQDGILKTAIILPKNVQSAIASKIKILSNLKIDETRLPQDGRFHYETAVKQVDLRVSVLPNVNGEKIVMRILDKTTKVPTLGQLGFRGKSLGWVLDSLKKTHGIFLITGPTGSGKSTTLYAILSMLNDIKVNIITLEDPVEYFMEGVNQTQVNPDIGLTFASGLRSILRQDPNIIMVGEIRDKETAELAVQAALTGHLVFSTLHTNDAIGALPRLIDMGMEPFLLSASINCVAAQRLTRKICPDCKEETAVSDDMKKLFENELKDVKPEELEGVNLKDMHVFRGKGCEKCGNTGYKGRIAIVEAFPVEEKIQQLVLEKASPADIFEEAKKIGMISLKQDGLIKVLQGITTYEEVVRVTSE